MSATRLLVLGVVRGYGRAHGYLIGHDLMSWGAEQWANVKWGSIYHALKQGVKSGQLREDWAVAGRTDYEITEKGELEFRRLLADALRKPEPRPDMLAAGLALLPALGRDEAIRLLTFRLDALEVAREQAVDLVEQGNEPPHLHELYGLALHNTDRDLEWTRGLLGRLRAGEYVMAGEQGSRGRAGSWSTPA